jgi:hypothetical protein
MTEALLTYGTAVVSVGRSDRTWAASSAHLLPHSIALCPWGGPSTASQGQTRGCR